MKSDKISGIFLVLGTYSISHQKNLVTLRKYVHCINQQGQEVRFDFGIFSEEYNAAYIERGDIIKIEKGRLVENLTTAKLKAEFVKSR